jgi:hypothetical protein
MNLDGGYELMDFLLIHLRKYHTKRISAGFEEILIILRLLFLRICIFSEARKTVEIYISGVNPVEHRTFHIEIV